MTRKLIFKMHFSKFCVISIYQKSLLQPFSRTKKSNILEQKEIELKINFFIKLSPIIYYRAEKD